MELPLPILKGGPRAQVPGDAAGVEGPRLLGAGGNQETAGVPTLPRRTAVAVILTGIPEDPSGILSLQLHTLQVASLQPGAEKDPSSPRSRCRTRRQVRPPGPGQRGCRGLCLPLGAAVTQKPCSQPQATCRGRRPATSRGTCFVRSTWREPGSTAEGMKGARDQRGPAVWGKATPRLKRPVSLSRQPVKGAACLWSAARQAHSQGPCKTQE